MSDSESWEELTSSVVHLNGASTTTKTKNPPQEVGKAASSSKKPLPSSSLTSINVSVPSSFSLSGSPCPEVPSKASSALARVEVQNAVSAGRGIPKNSEV
ncbi:hypothetical protein BT96DRAFT_1009039 [Gymnopus androsaceus JB14]|uniref:Uncharacterized protein n=1 Tax=Gymnopus androsaceus JB14 TaxID=1447944 RepID=A0A6A4GDD1_9AGAR|nr:hypothetical protein BT96DRAFT_1009039 [Gymnopus androsaceus JB14]